MGEKIHETAAATTTPERQPSADEQELTKICEAEPSSESLARLAEIIEQIASLSTFEMIVEKTKINGLALMSIIETAPPYPKIELKTHLEKIIKYLQKCRQSEKLSEAERQKAFNLLRSLFIKPILWEIYDYKSTLTNLAVERDAAFKTLLDRWLTSRNNALIHLLQKWRLSKDSKKAKLTNNLSEIKVIDILNAWRQAETPQERIILDPLFTQVMQIYHEPSQKAWQSLKEIAEKLQADYGIEEKDFLALFEADGTIDSATVAIWRQRLKEAIEEELDPQKLAELDRSLHELDLSHNSPFRRDAKTESEDLTPPDEALVGETIHNLLERARGHSKNPITPALLEKVIDLKLKSVEDREGQINLLLEISLNLAGYPNATIQRITDEVWQSNNPNITFIATRELRQNETVAFRGMGESGEQKTVAIVNIANYFSATKASSIPTLVHEITHALAAVEYAKNQETDLETQYPRDTTAAIRESITGLMEDETRILLGQSPHSLEKYLHLLIYTAITKTSLEAWKLNNMDDFVSQVKAIYGRELQLLLGEGYEAAENDIFRTMVQAAQEYGLGRWIRYVQAEAYSEMIKNAIRKALKISENVSLLTNDIAMQIIRAINADLVGFTAAKDPQKYVQEIITQTLSQRQPTA